MQQVDLPPAYERVGAQLRSALDADAVPPGAVAAVRDRVEGYGDNAPDYDEHAAVLEAAPPETGAIADLGSGPGTATLAYLTHLDRRGIDTVDAALVDACPAQHRQAGRLLDAVSFDLDAAVDRYVADIRAYGGAADTVLMSHVLTEQRDEAHDLLAHARDTAGDACYVVERVGDPLWDALDLEPSRLRASPGVLNDPVETAYAVV